MRDNGNISDADLFDRISKGEELAFKVLYYRYFDKVKSFLFSIHLDREADDIIQETFITVWKKRDTINPDLSFENYLFTIAKNFAIKAAKKKLVGELILANEIKEAVIPAVDDFVIFDEMESSLQSSIHKLPRRSKQVFTLRRGEGLSIEQIANQLELSKSTVENHMNKAIKSITKDLKITP